MYRKRGEGAASTFCRISFVLHAFAFRGDEGIIGTGAGVRESIPDVLAFLKKAVDGHRIIYNDFRARLMNDIEFAILCRRLIYCRAG